MIHEAHHDCTGEDCLVCSQTLPRVRSRVSSTEGGSRVICGFRHGGINHRFLREPRIDLEPENMI